MYFSLARGKDLNLFFYYVARLYLLDHIIIDIDYNKRMIGRQL